VNRIAAALERARRADADAGSVWLNGSTPEAIDGAAVDLGEPRRVLSPKASKQFAEHLAARRVISVGQTDGAIDAYRILRTQILARMRPQQHTTLAIVGATTGDGASHTAANLAMSMVMDPQNSVLLVDCNLKQPRLHDLFGIALSPGLADYFTRGAAPGPLIAHPPIERLAVLPAGAVLANSPELLGSQRMQQLIKAFKSQSPRRFVIFDLPAVLQFADAVSLIPCVDAVLLVVAARKTRAEQVAQAGELLANANLIGTVLNRNTSAASGFSVSQASAGVS
jgi:protein-tyrosine kinase